MQTLDETTLTYGEAIKVLKHTIHLIREEAQKSEIENKTKESMCVGFEIRSLSRDEWKENLLARDQNGKENKEDGFSSEKQSGAMTIGLGILTTLNG